MQHMRPLHVLYAVKHVYKAYDVVTVHGTEVPCRHSLKEVLLTENQRLETVIETYNAVCATLIKKMHLAQSLRHHVTYLVVYL